MTRRPRSHVLEDLAKAKIIAELSAFGWTVEPLHRDYGEDFLVTVFKRGAKTEKFFFLQSKATDSIDRYFRTQSGQFEVSVQTANFRLWSRLRVPVVLTLFDAGTDRVYWSKISKAATVARRRSQSAVAIPPGNTFSQRGGRRLKTLIEKEFAELDALDNSAELIVRNLKKITKLDVTFEPKGGLLIVPSGRFLSDGGQDHWIFFGPLREFLHKRAAKAGVSPKKLIERSMGWHLETRGREGK